MYTMAFTEHQKNPHAVYQLLETYPVALIDSKGEIILILTSGAHYEDGITPLDQVKTDLPIEPVKDQPLPEDGMSRIKHISQNS